MALIQEHASSFSWKPSDMQEIKPEVMTHKLNVFPDPKPIKYKKKVFSKEKQQAMREEVEKLEEIRFVREVIYPQWLANFVLVKKVKEKYRMCLDFTYLNQVVTFDYFKLLSFPLGLVTLSIKNPCY